MQTNNKKEITLYTPNVKDLWFRQECMSDPNTMQYNAGYDLNFEGYHKDTGCIDFPKEKWDTWAKEKLSNSNFFYAYIKDLQTSNFVGYVNFNKNPNTNIATMGIVIKSEFQGQGYMRPAMIELINQAKKHGVSTLTDTVPENRKNALKVFYDLGFIKTDQFVSKKFDKDETVAVIELKLK